MFLKPYVMGDKSGAKINPLEGIVGTAKQAMQDSFAEHIHMKTSGTEEGKKHPDNILDEKKLKKSFKKAVDKVTP